MRIRVFLFAALVSIICIPFLAEDIPAIGGYPVAINTSQAPSAALNEELAVLRNKEEILEEHFSSLQEEKKTADREMRAIERVLNRAHGEISPFDEGAREEAAKKRAGLRKRLAELEQLDRDLRRANAVLMALTKNREQLEAFLLDSYRAVASTLRSRALVDIDKLRLQSYTFLWPVAPEKGISARFMEESYKKRFGFEHHAIDIPTAQGTEIHAPADAVVKEIHDRGFGYSTVLLTHEDGISTLYGHVSSFFAKEGDHIAAGEAFALSGGRPGTRGAGFFTTGPHLHFETWVDGQPVDPEFFLPPISVVAATAK